MSTKVFSTPRLYQALKAEGFPLPEECGDVQLDMPVDGLFRLHYTIMLNSEQVAALGRAMQRLTEGAVIDTRTMELGPTEYNFVHKDLK